MEEIETFDNALTDILVANIMENFDSQLRKKIKEIIKAQDSKALRQLIRNLCKSLG